MNDFLDFNIHKIIPDEFPSALREINDPPKELFLRGKLPEKTTFLTIVGSRKNTSYGKDVIESLLLGLSGYPITIVSGLALGTDALAHHNALNSGLKTIAFPGSGLDWNVLYPATNLALAKKILEADGALISEFAPNMRATKYTFPMRNRLMAGMSPATLIIEASEKSGTLITARLAMEYNRDVLAVPGPISNKNSWGPNILIKDGAIPIHSSEDILEALSIKNDTKKERAVSAKSNERKILDQLTEPKTKDELLRNTSYTISELNMILTEMEICGLIKESDGKISLK